MCECVREAVEGLGGAFGSSVGHVVCSLCVRSLVSTGVMEAQVDGRVTQM